MKVLFNFSAVVFLTATGLGIATQAQGNETKPLLESVSLEKTAQPPPDSVQLPPVAAGLPISDLAHVQQRPHETPMPRPIVAATPVPVRVLTVNENQPVHIVDNHGRLLQIIYLRRK